VARTARRYRDNDESLAYGWGSRRVSPHVACDVTCHPLQWSHSYALTGTRSRVDVALNFCSALTA